MGYYITNTIPFENRENTERINVPTSLKSVNEDEAIICEIDNGYFIAFGYAYSEEELQEFKREDGRPKKWWKMPLKEAQKLSGYAR